jgi:Zn-finger nucleic acid-binding protein
MPYNRAVGATVAPANPKARNPVTMNCPRCETTPLVERDREGIVVDGCPACRGLWLDRGELEKLIARATREIEEPWDGGGDTRPRGLPYDRDRDDDDDRRYREDPRYRHDPRRKRSWFESLGEMFD